MSDTARRHIVCLIGDELDFDRMEHVAREVGGPGFDIDRETCGMRSGEGFRLSSRCQPRRVLEHAACERYDADDPFVNPYGYWRLTAGSA